MTLSELHPDELLWREACGTLTPDERADLSAHSQRCPACALERVVRMEAARARVPSEADHAIAARLVDRVLATHERRPVTAMGVGWRRPLAAAVAVVVLAAGTAFAATALVVRVRAQRATRTVALSRPAASAEPAVRPRGSAVSPGPRSPDRGQVVDPGAPVDPGPSAAGGQTLPVVSPPRDRRSLRDTARFRPRPSPAFGRSSPAPAGPSPTPAPSAEAASAPPAPPPPRESAPAVVDSPVVEAPQILRRAEQARTARRWADAGRAFVDLGRRYPGTREEIVGRALYGQLLLDQLGEPKRALTMFERYLAVDPSGALAEEARLGRAQALRRLGQPREERSAWLDLLREHPGSVHVPAARTRLAALDVP